MKTVSEKQGGRTVGWGGLEERRRKEKEVFDYKPHTDNPCVSNESRKA